jgi:hypothetical protein
VGDEISADEDQPHDAPAAEEAIASDCERLAHDVEDWDAADESEEEGLESDGEGDDDDGDGNPGKLSHRAIPTWEQAIGLIVATNMESRAKNPGAGKPRGRGRRGPRDRSSRN